MTEFLGFVILGFGSWFLLFLLPRIVLAVWDWYEQHADGREAARIAAYREATKPEAEKRADVLKAVQAVHAADHHLWELDWKELAGSDFAPLCSCHGVSLRFRGCRCAA